MSLRVADRVDDWDQRPFDGSLSALADADFSGVVRASGAELYMTGGAIVDIRHGTIEDVQSGSGTVYEAPEPALPLLAVMQDADTDVRAQYYTEETPISEVQGTLSDGGFTGYLELSENVLSGDYFLVFHGGNSTAVGFVGTSDQLIAGDEAFETADDEVGIYKVRQVDIEPIEIPADDEAAPAGGTVAEEPAAADDEPEPDAEIPAAESEPADADADAASESAPAGDAAPEEPASSTAVAEASADESAATEAGAPEPEVEATRDESGTRQSAEETGSRTAGGASQSQRGGESIADAARGRDADAFDEGSGGDRREATRSQGAQRGAGGQAGDLETRAIPSLDPELTAVPSREAGGVEPGAEVQPDTAPEGQPEPQQAEGGGAAPAEGAERGTEIERVEAELEEVRAERDELEAELEDAVAEREELAAEVERLEAELRRLEEELGAATDAEQRMTPGEAIEGTNLFVDYDSKGQATLEDAHGGSESREEVAENLQLGVHTEFEEANVAVNGQDFGQFLRSTLHYRFAEWLIDTLLFEIRDTGHAEALTDLYDAIPEIRRVEFNGTIDVEYVEDGQEKGGREAFDVIFRHRMGDPLVVANLNDARDPATGGMMETLVTSGERVGQTADSLSAAFLVTSSFFESEALETVSQATQGGILSRDKRTSFVNLSRKQGYHLCLVAAREGNFHMEVPEL